MGAERDPLMFSGLVAILVGGGGLTKLSIVTAILFWIVALIALRRMAKADPMMSSVWRKYYNQQDYYPARTSPWKAQ